MQDSSFFLENYNLINYVKIIDLSLLNIFDFIDINEGNGIIDNGSQLVLNLGTRNKKLLEGFIIDNISNMTYYNKKNILINTCLPSNNWRNRKNTFKKTPRIGIRDKSIFIDEIKLNSFATSLFKRLMNRQNSEDHKSVQSKTMKLYFLEFNSIDVEDIYDILKKILVPIGGKITSDGFSYNIIYDNNSVFGHETMDSLKMDESKFDNESRLSGALLSEVQQELIKKEIY